MPTVPSITSENSGPLVGSVLPNGGIGLPNIGPFGSRAILEAIRATQLAKVAQNMARGKHTPSYETLKAREDAMLQGIGKSRDPLNPHGWDPKQEVGRDGTFGKVPGNGINSPKQRTNRGLIILDLVTLEQIELHFVPKVLDYNPEPNWSVIASMARNNPLYHYTGSEDSLTFEIDWFSKDTDDARTDVILNCKKLEALSKNNGFEEPPHLIKLIWNDKMFSEATWVMFSAPYKLSMFQAHKSMLPQQAIQSVTLKKVVANNKSNQNIRSIGT